LILPPPRSFNDGQRALYGVLMAIAGVCFGLAALAAGAVIIWGVWPPELAKTRLLLIGGALGGAILGSISVTIALAVGGPVGRFKVAASRDGASVEADKGDDDAA
jgi:hypothetical protein